MNNSIVEIVKADGLELAYIINATWRPAETTFLTPNKLPLQMGMIVYDKEQIIVPHLHLPIERRVHGTTECIVVREGHCVVDIYDMKQSLVSTHELVEGSIILLLNGGHGFRMLENTVLFEVKQGPYAGEQDKQRFEKNNFC